VTARRPGRPGACAVGPQPWPPDHEHVRPGESN